MTEAKVIFEKRKAVARVTLNKPSVKNGMGKMTLSELPATRQEKENRGSMGPEVIRKNRNIFRKRINFSHIPNSKRYSFSHGSIDWILQGTMNA
jgi:enoyl-CoA hydratase/carnithine racemase